MRCPRIGRGAEDLGFDHLLAYDHVLGAVHAGWTPPLTGPYTEHDPFVVFAYLAGITEQIRFATGVPEAPGYDKNTTRLQKLSGCATASQHGRTSPGNCRSPGSGRVAAGDVTFIVRRVAGVVVDVAGQRRDVA